MGKINRGNQGGGDKGIEFEICPPERKRGNSTVLACSCSCSCCVHSVGSVIGAVAGTVLKRSRSSFHAIAVYWCLLPILVSLYVGFLLLIGKASGDAVIYAVFYLPGAQLVASALAAAWVALSTNRKHHLKTIGKITLGTIIGGLVGYGIMIPWM